MLKTPRSKAQELLRMYGEQSAINIIHLISELEGIGKWLMIPNNNDVQWLDYWRDVLKEIKNEINKPNQ